MSKEKEKQEIEKLNEQCKIEIKKIKDKYNKLKKDVRQKYKKPSKSKRVSIPKVLKNLVWDTNIGKSRGIGKCYCCNRDIDSKNFEAGHIISVKNGGKTNLENLKPICSCCNKSMGTTNLEEFKKKYMCNSKKDDFVTSLDQHPLFDFMNQSNRRTGFQTFNNNSNLFGIDYNDRFNHHL